jgi:predicted dehydrogenase
LDYLLWLFGSVHCVTSAMGILGDLEISAEDTADILLGHSSGVLSSLHLDYLQRDPVRRCRVVGTEGTLIWDYYSNQVQCFNASTGGWERHSFEMKDRNEMYVAELMHFIKCVEERKTPLVSVGEGVQVLQVALAAKEAARTGQRQEVSYDL